MRNYRLVIDSTPTAAVSKEAPIIEGVRESNKSIPTRISQDFTISNTEDYSLIFDEDYNHTFECELQYWNGTSYVVEYVAEFKKTDCTIDEERGIITFKPMFRSLYDLINEFKGQTYDVFDLGVSPQSVAYNQTGVLQLYNYQGVVMNLGRGFYGESPSDESLLTFEEVKNDGWEATANDTLIDVSDFYIGIFYIEQPYAHADVYRFLSYDHANLTWTYSNDVGDKIIKLSIFGDNLITSLEVSTVQVAINTIDRTLVDTQNKLTTPLYDPTTEALLTTAYMFNPVYRMLTNQVSIDGNTTEENNGGVLGLSAFRHLYAKFYLYNLLEITENSNVLDQGYGAFPDDATTNPGEYYETPDAVNDWIPIFQSQWNNVSYWIKNETELHNIIDSGTVGKSTKAAYKIDKLIHAILQDIHTSLSLVEDSSVYLGDTNPINQLGIGGDGTLKHFIIPHSNIVSDVGITPNQKLEITLDQLFQCVFNSTNGGYRLNASNVLEIEHKEYFERGMSYGANVIGLDGTDTIDARTGLPESFRTKNYRHNIAETYRKLTLNVGSSSGLFQSKTIEAIDEYVEDRTEAPVIPFPTNLSEIIIKDEAELGWMLAGCETSALDIDYIPYVEFVFNGKNYKGENGLMSPLWILRSWYAHQTPCVNIEIDGVSIASQSQMKIKENDIIVKFKDYDPYQMASTLVGDGTIVKYANNRMENQVKLTVRYGI